MMSELLDCSAASQLMSPLGGIAIARRPLFAAGTPLCFHCSRTCSLQQDRPQICGQNPAAQTRQSKNPSCDHAVRAPTPAVAAELWTLRFPTRSIMATAISSRRRSSSLPRSRSTDFATLLGDAVTPEMPTDSIISSLSPNQRRLATYCGSASVSINFLAADVNAPARRSRMTSVTNSSIGSGAGVCQAGQSLAVASANSRSHTAATSAGRGSPIGGKGVPALSSTGTRPLNCDRSSSTACELCATLATHSKVSSRYSRR